MKTNETPDLKTKFILRQLKALLKKNWQQVECGYLFKLSSYTAIAT